MERVYQDGYVRSWDKIIGGGIVVMCTGCHVGSHVICLDLAWVMHCQQGACRHLQISAHMVDCKSIASLLCILLNKYGENRVTVYVYIADAYLNLLGGSEISSVLNPLVSQLTDSADLLPTTIHLTS